MSPNLVVVRSVGLAEHTPTLFRAFKKALNQMEVLNKENAYGLLYRKLEPVGFSEQVLPQAPSSLAVQMVDGVQWSDLGEPGRVIDTLKTLKSRPKWLEDFAKAYKRGLVSLALPEGSGSLNRHI
jgi:hypothetical protein